jgi:hypothetical protein
MNVTATAVESRHSPTWRRTYRRRPPHASGVLQKFIWTLRRSIFWAKRGRSSLITAWSTAASSRMVPASRPNRAKLGSDAGSEAIRRRAATVSDSFAKTRTAAPELSEKYDWLLDEYLMNAEYASRRLDVNGARELATTLANGHQCR